MRMIRISAICALTLLLASGVYALPCAGCGSCLSQLNHDTTDCDEHYSTGPDGRPTPFAHAGCILDATTAYYACVWQSSLG